MKSFCLCMRGGQVRVGVPPVRPPVDQPVHRGMCDDGHVDMCTVRSSRLPFVYVRGRSFAHFVAASSFCVVGNSCACLLCHAFASVHPWWQGLGIMVIAGAVSKWYFTADKSKDLPRFPCCGSFRRTCRYSEPCPAFHLSILCRLFSAVIVHGCRLTDIVG
jgi:hypothetical protein